MKVTSLFLSSLVVWIVSTAIGWLTCGWLFSWIYEIPPKIWLDPHTMTATGNMIAMFLVGLIGAFLFVLVYAIVYSGIPGFGVKKGLTYGFLIWLISALAGMATIPFYMTISAWVVVYWIIQALVIKLVTGALLGVMYKK